MAGEQWPLTRAIPRANLRCRRSGKKLPEVLATLLTPDVVKGRHVRLMFQDEARLGRMVRIQRCGAPALQRPVVDNGYEREFRYVYGAVSPLEGELDWMISPGHEYRTDGNLSRQCRPP